jgi:hypothetical protein
LPCIRLPGGVLRFESDVIGQFVHKTTQKCTNVTEFSGLIGNNCNSMKRSPTKRPPLKPSRKFIDWVAEFGPLRLARALGVWRSSVHSWVTLTGIRRPPRIETAIEIVALSRIEPLRGIETLTISDIFGEKIDMVKHK